MKSAVCAAVVVVIFLMLASLFWVSPTGSEPATTPTVTATPTALSAKPGTIHLRAEAVPSSTKLSVADVLTVTVSVYNESDSELVSFGALQYSLRVEQDNDFPILEPDRPEPIVHQLSIWPGENDSASFIFHASHPGIVMIRSHVSGEIGLGSNGPWYWSGVSAQPITVTVEYKTYLPVIHYNSSLKPNAFYHFSAFAPG